MLNYQHAVHFFLTLNTKVQSLSPVILQNKGSAIQHQFYKWPVLITSQKICNPPTGVLKDYLHSFSPIGRIKKQAIFRYVWPWAMQAVNFLWFLFSSPWQARNGKKSAAQQV